MTLSPQVRADNLQLLMTKLISIVGDDDVYKHVFQQGDRQFTDILPTSWGKLRMVIGCKTSATDGIS